ncbi:hypothetical protein FrEUN1fDRAFT_7654, partial [Parafrankia sp. EUN1f]
MAASQEGTQLTSQHRRAQLALRATTTNDMKLIWPMFDGSDASYSAFVDAAINMVMARQETSSGLASAYYQRFRSAEGVAGEMIPKLAPRLGSGLIRAALFATGLAGTRRAIGAGQTTAAALDSGLVQAA